ncbi:unnamed protein product, partial [Polarella glacialis]
AWVRAVEPNLGTAEVVALASTASRVRAELRRGASAKAPRGPRWVPQLRLFDARGVKQALSCLELSGVESLEVRSEPDPTRLEGQGISGLMIRVDDAGALLASLVPLLWQLGPRCQSVKLVLNLPSVMQRELEFAGADAYLDGLFWELAEAFSCLERVRHFSLSMTVDSYMHGSVTEGTNDEEIIRLQHLLLEDLVWLLSPWFETVEELEMHIETGWHLDYLSDFTPGLLLFYILSMPHLKSLRCAPTFSLGHIHNFAVDLIQVLKDDEEEEHEDSCWMLWQVRKSFAKDVDAAFKDVLGLFPDIRTTMDAFLAGTPPSHYVPQPASTALQLCRALAVIRIALQRCTLECLEISIGDSGDVGYDVHDCDLLSHVFEFLLRDHPSLKDVTALPTCCAGSNYERGRCQLAYSRLLGILNGKTPLRRLILAGGNSHLTSEFKEGVQASSQGRVSFNEDFPWCTL